MGDPGIGRIVLVLLVLALLGMCHHDSGDRHEFERDIFYHIGVCHGSD